MMAGAPPPMMAGAPPPMMDGARKRRRAMEWVDLPPDILLLISDHLNSTWDFVRFRGVCSSWRSAANSADRPPQVPSLLLPYDRSTAALSFLDLTDRRIHTIIVPEARWKQICGTPHGWLVLLGDEMISNIRSVTVSLLNPITRAQISLPPLSDFEQQIELVLYSSKAVLSANPASSQEVLLALLVCHAKLAICRLGEGETWRVINLHDPADPTRTILDLAYFGDTFYVVDCYKGITVYDPATNTKIYSAHTIRRGMRFKDTLHLVETSGDLLLLHRRNIGLQFFEVFKLDRGNCRKLKWARIEESIGGRTLFLSNNHTSISLSSRDFTRSEREQRDIICFAGDGEQRDLICFAGDGDDYTSYMKAATISISDIASGSSAWDGPHYWKSSRTQLCLGKLSGLTWVVPSPF